MISARQAARLNHYMPATLVESQFASLEEPGPDERPIVVSVEPRPGEIVLMHAGSNPYDGSTSDADALPRVIRQLRLRGYEFVRLSRVMRPAP